MEASITAPRAGQGDSGRPSARCSRWRAATCCWCWSSLASELAGRSAGGSQQGGHCKPVEQGHMLQPPPTRRACGAAGPPGRMRPVTRIIAGRRAGGGSPCRRRAPGRRRTGCGRRCSPRSTARPRAGRCRGARPVRGLGRARAGGALARRRARAVRRERPAGRRGAAAQRRGHVGLPGAAVRAASAAAVLAAPADRAYDVVLVDPPYAMPDAEVAGWLAAAAAHGWLADDAVVVVERGRGPAFPGPRRWSRCGSGATATRSCTSGRGTGRETSVARDAAHNRHGASPAG